MTVAIVTVAPGSDKRIKLEKWLWKLIFISLATLVAASSNTPDSVANVHSLNGTVKLEDRHQDSVFVPVFYITSRKAEKEPGYSTDRSDSLDFGRCTVTLPTSFKEGPDPGLTGDLGYKVKDGSHQIRVAAPERFDNTDDFISAVKSVQDKRSDKRVIVFVHGYNCSFEKAMKIGSKLSYGTTLPVIVYSWPSQNHILAYSADECNAEWSALDFEHILNLLSQKFGTENLTLISHSMGCRIIVWALNPYSNTLATQAANPERLQHIFFSCPDIDKDTFAKYYSRIANASKDTKIFVSSKDMRLAISQALHGSSRLGRPVRHSHEVPLIPGIETVDFSALDHGIGHYIPYTLIFQTLNHEVAQDGIQLIRKTNKDVSRSWTQAVRIARKH
jgi:esterase/lipase superfamily enzyme